MKKVLISEWVPGQCLAPYRAEVEFTLPDAEKQAFAYDELIKMIAEYEGLLILDNTGDRALIDAGKRLEALANFGVGYDNIDWKYATEVGLPVINTPLHVTETTAEHAAAMCVAAMRNIARYDREVRAGVWNSPNFSGLNADIHGSTVGILGMGRIGKRVAAKLKGFGMEVLYSDKYRLSPEQEAELGVTYMDMEEVLERADCVSLHMPYTPENHHLFTRAVFQRMKPGAFFVNCARGKLVHEQDLAEVLREGHLRGAALDVFENEPEVHADLLKLENVTFTPHIASLTLKTRMGMCEEALSGICGVLRGERPANVVNPQVFG